MAFKEAMPSLVFPVSVHREIFSIIQRDVDHIQPEDKISQQA